MTDTQGQSLDTLLNGTPAETVANTEAPAPVEMGDKPDASGPPPAARELDDGPLVPRKALEDERRKRQDYEKRLTEMEAQIRANQTRQQQPEPQAPQDWWTDPEAAAAHQRQEFQFQIYETRLLLGEELLSSKEDYEPAKSAFIQAANQDANLARKMVMDRNPAKFAYETGKKLLAQREVGDDLKAYKAKLRAEWEAERGYAPAPNNSAPKTPAPKSLAGQPSAQPRDTSGRFQGPASLQDILGG